MKGGHRPFIDDRNRFMGGAGNQSHATHPVQLRLFRSFDRKRVTSGQFAKSIKIRLDSSRCGLL